MAQSVKINYIFNLINTGTQLLFPLITFPYACRVIEAEGIGQVNFFTSIVQYISLFTCLGIPLYAVREIARDRNDVVKMNRTATEILLLHTLLTIIGYLIVGILCLCVPQIQTDVPLFLVLSLTIFFTAIGCEWFYQGIEDFKYITIRGIVVKCISLILLFVFVRTKDDLIYYGWYTVIGVLGGNVFNFIRLRRYIHKENVIFSQLDLGRHLKPVLKVFSFTVVTSVYLQLNPVLLGFMKDALAVGYFTAATKLMSMFMKLSSCLGAVMMPRASHLIAENKEEEFNSLIQKSYDFTIAVSLPLVMILMITAPLIVRLLCGSEFAPAVLSSQIVAPVILLVGISNVMGIQVLYPKGKINLVITSCLIGAITDLILNICLIPSFSYEGTAVAYLGAEVATTFSMYFIAREYLPIRYIHKSHLVYLLGSVLMAVMMVSALRLLPYSDLPLLIIIGLSGILVYGITLLIGRDALLWNLINRLIKRQ